MLLELGLLHYPIGFLHLAIRFLLGGLEGLLHGVDCAKNGVGALRVIFLLRLVKHLHDCGEGWLWWVSESSDGIVSGALVLLVFS